MCAPIIPSQQPPIVRVIPGLVSSDFVNSHEAVCRGLPGEPSGLARPSLTGKAIEVPNLHTVKRAVAVCRLTKEYSFTAIIETLPWSRPRRDCPLP